MEDNGPFPDLYPTENQETTLPYSEMSPGDTSGRHGRPRSPAGTVFAVGALLCAALLAVVALVAGSGRTQLGLLVIAGGVTAPAVWWFIAGAMAPGNPYRRALWVPVALFGAGLVVVGAVACLRDPETNRGGDGPATSSTAPAAPARTSAPSSPAPTSTSPSRTPTPEATPRSPSSGSYGGGQSPVPQAPAPDPVQTPAPAPAPAPVPQLPQLPQLPALPELPPLPQLPQLQIPGIEIPGLTG
ncbi:hypothetical protein [Corynebacterium provencense]|uniref:hypothetical protein n=1 Tax=Corynebacterium provencense TaxID=1737425 RepID=UPI000830944B|nr:hypothetical protein [Corynebacterium provencense]